MIHQLITINLLLLLSLNFKSYSQTIQRVSSYELCNVDAVGTEINCKKFAGTSLFESFRIDPQFTLEFKYVNQANFIKTRWDDKKVTDYGNGIYSYTLIENKPNGTDNTYLLVLLAFDKDTDKLLSAFYSVVKDKVPITCKLKLDK